MPIPNTETSLYVEMMLSEVLAAACVALIREVRLRNGNTNPILKAILDNYAPSPEVKAFLRGEPDVEVDLGDEMFRRMAPERLTLVGKGIGRRR